jgi:ABC-type lipoprotein release transport system permease subunit
MIAVYPIKNLRRRSARSVLLVIGVALAITLTTIMFSISEGINSSTKELIEETQIELFVYPEASNPILQEFTKYLDLEGGRDLAQSMREGNPSIRAASPILVEGLFISSGVVDETAKGKISVGKDEYLPRIVSVTGKGYVPELLGDYGAIDWVAGNEIPTASDPFYANGSYSGGTNSERFTHEIVLNKHLADLMDVGVGDIIYANSVGLPLLITNSSFDSWKANATWFEVYGIVIERYEPPSILSAGMHLSELQYLTGKHKVNLFGVIRTDFVNEIYIDLHDPSEKDEVKRWLEEDFEGKNKITVLTSEELAGEFNSFLDIFKGFSTMIIVITSLVVVLFISTIMVISVREQGREIGMLRAIGISKSTIIKYIVIESVFICILGFILGIILGYAGAGMLDDIIRNTEDDIPVGIEITTITPDLIIQVSLITFVIGILASVTPAVWAARLQPVESIRKI